MDKDILGVVTFDRLKRAVEYGTDDSYNSLLLDRYLTARMKDLSLLGYIDLEELRKVLALFSIRLGAPNSEHGAILDRSVPELKWFTYMYDDNSTIPRVKKWVIVTTGGVKIVYEKYKKSNQRPYKDLPPDLQKKIIECKKKRAKKT